jgi:hypothetical protein
MITKAVASAAIFVGLSLVGAAPAGADPSKLGPTPNPNPFAGLTSHGQQHAPSAVTNFGDVDRGLRAALATPTQ